MHVHTCIVICVCVCVWRVCVHVCKTVLVPWGTNACLSPPQWCLEINRNIPCCLESFVPECVLFWDLTESSQTGWFPVWAARKTRDLLELKIALGLMAWALTEPGKVLELRGGEHNHQQHADGVTHDVTIPRGWEWGSLISIYPYFTRFCDLISCFSCGSSTSHTQLCHHSLLATLVPWHCYEVYWNWQFQEIQKLVFSWWSVRVCWMDCRLPSLPYCYSVLVKVGCREWGKKNSMSSNEVGRVSLNPCPKENEFLITHGKFIGFILPLL